MKRGTRILVWTAAVVAALLTAVVIFVATFDWNRAKPYINAKASAALGRPFAINGNLGVHWRRDREHGDWFPGPVFTAEDITVANPDWAQEKQFATLRQVEFRLSLLPLLARRITVPTLQLQKPTVHLEKQGDKRNNWTFDLPKGTGEPSAWSMDLREIGFDTGTVTLHDAPDKIDATVDIDTLGKPIPFADLAGTIGSGAAEKARAQRRAQDFVFGFKAKGSYNGAKVSGSGKTGGVLALRTADSAFPIQADVRIGDVRIGLTGSVTDPTSPDGIDVRLHLAGDSLAHLFPVIGVSLPDTPPFQTDGHVTGRFENRKVTVTYEGFNGKIGNSDVHGTVTYAQVEPRPKLSGKVWSDELQFADLGPLIGLDSGDRSKASDATPPGGKDAPKRPAGGKVLPNEPFRTDRWNVMDADIAFNGKRVVRAGDLPISDLQAHVKLEGGALALDPLNFGLAGGEAKSVIHLDGRASPMKGDIRLDGRHFKLSDLFPTMKTMQDALGEVNADLALSATGNSVAALLGSSNGELKLLMNDGVVSRELMELAGLNVGNYIVVKLFGDEPVKINCAATDFVAKDGVMNTRVALFDTENALINIDGSVDFSDEKLDIDITPHTKGLRIFSLRTPLYVKGTFGKPDVGVHTGQLLLRGGAALVLGVFATPAAALIPLIAPSKDKDANPCGALLEQMKGDAKAPPAGKKS